MTHEVTVALVAGGYPQLKPPLGEQRQETLYADRKKVTLEIDGDETLRAVFDRAIADIAPEYDEGWEGVGEFIDLVYWVSFYLPEDDTKGLPQPRWTPAHQLPVVGPDGRARWGLGLDAPYDDLVRAADHGVLEGDPRRPYLILQPPGGDELSMTWTVVKTALEIAASIEGGLAIKDRIRRRIGRGTEVIDRHAEDWTAHGADPLDVKRMLERRPWESRDLAILLGIDDDEVEPLLNVLGFDLDADGRWSPSETEEARLLRMIEDETYLSFGPFVSAERQYRERAAQLMETGERPPPPQWFDDDITAEAEDGDELGPMDRLPRDLLSIDCACGNDACRARVRVSRVNDGAEAEVRLDFSDVADHFQFPLTLFARISIQLVDDVGEENLF